MDRLHTMRVFVAVAEARGFAAAARHMALSPPAVTRAVAALEARIGTRLFRRTTRVVRLTDAGVRFLADCRRVLAELERAEAHAAGAQEEVRGQLAVTASVTFGRMFVANLVLQYLARYPQVSARTFFVDRLVDLVDEGIDVAVRIAQLPDSSMTAVRVGQVRRVLCASPPTWPSMAIRAVQRIGEPSAAGLCITDARARVVLRFRRQVRGRARLGALGG